MNYNYIEVKVCVEFSTTMIAAKPFDSAMYFYMFIEVSSLSEAKSTIIKRALVLPFICMNSQVVKEIVPLSKMLSTVFVIAF